MKKLVEELGSLVEGEKSNLTKSFDEYDDDKDESVSFEDERSPLDEKKGEKGFWDDAEVISSYSRKQAISDGMLADVSKFAKGYFKFPMAFTSALWSVVKRTSTKSGHDMTGIMHDIFSLMQMAARRSGGDRIKFKVRIGRKDHSLMAVIGPGDTAAPVMTVGYPEDF